MSTNIKCPFQGYKFKNIIIFWTQQTTLWFVAENENVKYLIISLKISLLIFELTYSISNLLDPFTKEYCSCTALNGFQM